jgi:hypothetical protein
VCYENFENVHECNFDVWLQTDMCELSFQHMTDIDIANAAAKQKGEEESGEHESEKGRLSSECISHSMFLQCVDIRLHASERVSEQ